MSILRIRDKNGNVIDIPAFKGEQGPQGEKGDSGVYLGSDEPDNNANVWVDTSGEATIPEDIEQALNNLSNNKADKAALSLGIASDGLIYLFIDGAPVGAGIPQGINGDVFGYVDENNTIVLTGSLAKDTTYNVKYEMEDGSTIDIGELVLEEESDDSGNTSNGYTFNLNKRYSASGKALTDVNGVIAVAIPVSDLVDKSIRLSGFEYGLTYKGNGLTPWYIAVSDGGVAKTYTTDDLGFWGCNDGNFQVTAEDDGTYLCKFAPLTNRLDCTLWINIAINSDGTAITENDLVGKSIELVSEVPINALPLSTNSDGTLYVGDNGEQGYKTGYRVSTSSSTEKQVDSGACCSGFMPINIPKTSSRDVYVYIKNLGIPTDPEHINICVYNQYYSIIQGGCFYYNSSDFAWILQDGTLEENDYTWVIDMKELKNSTAVKYFRISGIITDKTEVWVDDKYK